MLLTDITWQQGKHTHTRGICFPRKLHLGLAMKDKRNKIHLEVPNTLGASVQVPNKGWGTTVPDPAQVSTEF